jgi:hypothetical protein
MTADEYLLGILRREAALLDADALTDRELFVLYARVLDTWVL